MATTNTWTQVVEKISGVTNRGSFSKTFTPTASSQSASGGAGYYSSVYTACNAVSLSGNAAIGQVLTGCTFYNTSLTKATGTMANRGALNWNPSSSTTYSVSAGYYSGGTLNSSGAYNAGVTATDNRTNTNSTNYKNGYNAGKSAGLTVKSMSVAVSYSSSALSCNEASGTTNRWCLKGSYSISGTIQAIYYGNSNGCTLWNRMTNLVVTTRSATGWKGILTTGNVYVNNSGFQLPVYSKDTSVTAMTLYYTP